MNNNQQQNNHHLPTSTQAAALPLQDHQVVLGRYGNNKVKALTAATEIYKKVRSQIRRSGNVRIEELDQIKKTIGVLMQERMMRRLLWSASDLQWRSYHDNITFWVDQKKAKQAGMMEEMMHAHPQLCSWRDAPSSGSTTGTSGEQETTSFFVQDKEDYFLRADLATKRHEIKIPTHEKSRIQRMLMMIPTPPSSLAEVSDVSDRSSSHSMDHHSTHSMKRTSESLTIPTAPSTGDSSLTMDVDELMDHSTSFQFGLTVGSSLTLEQQMERVCCHWICNENTCMNDIERKNSLSKTYKAYVTQYQELLLDEPSNNPLLNASIQSGLRDLNESLLIQVANTIGNAMVQWYERFPSSCLPGEPNAWINELNQQQPDTTDTVNGAHSTTVEDESSGSVLGSFSGSDSEEEIQATLSDDEEMTLASYYFDQFNLSSCFQRKRIRYNNNTTP